MTADGSLLPPVGVCPGCSAELPPALLACPTCGQLVHAAALKDLAAQAERAEQERDLTGALGTWRKVQDLLPRESVQHRRILEKVQALSAQVSTMPTDPTRPQKARRSGWKKWAVGLGAFGLLLAKFKWVIVFLLAKGKVLLIGLTQAKTFFTMALAVGVYTTVFGWWFALGLVLSIYVHEMGHVVWLRRYGIAATAPMFIPGLGAFVRMKQYPATPGEDARVGLAGPVWGAAAAIVALILGLALKMPILIAIARVGAWVNLFNLLPVWQLDGGRGFAALSRRQRGWAAGVLWLLALTGVDGVLFLLAIAATFRAAIRGQAPETGDRNVLIAYVVLVAGLTLLMVKAV